MSFSCKNLKAQTKISWPEREKYLAELKEVEDLVKACDVKLPGSNRGDGEITYDEGQQCLSSSVSTEPWTTKSISNIFSKMCSWNNYILLYKS